MKKKEDGQIAININIAPDINNAIPVSKTEKTNSLSKSPKSDTLNKESTKNKPSESKTSPN